MILLAYLIYFVNSKDLTPFLHRLLLTFTFPADIPTLRILLKIASRLMRRDTAMEQFDLHRKRSV